MATSFSSPGLAKATTNALVSAQPELNIARLFANDMSAEFADWGTTVKVPLIASTAEEFDISSADYEHSAGSISYVSVVLNKQPKATLEFKGADLLEAPDAPYWTKCALAGANAVKKSISTTLGGLLNATDCTGTGVVMASVTKANVAKLRTNCVARISETILALEPTYFAELLALLDSNVYGGDQAIRNGYIPGLYGFKAVIPAYDLGDGIKGALIPQDAIAFASRAVSVANPQSYNEFGVATDDFGFAITTMRHGAAAKGKAFLNMTSLYGAKVVKGSEVKIITAS